jgi:hypothetical protein
MRQNVPPPYKVYGPGAPDTRPVYDPAHRNQSNNKEFEKCYSADGGEVYIGHSVDVRELIEQGWTREPPAVDKGKDAA